LKLTKHAGLIRVACVRPRKNEINVTKKCVTASGQAHNFNEKEVARNEKQLFALPFRFHSSEVTEGESAKNPGFL
jgi:hypothetical protein